MIDFLKIVTTFSGRTALRITQVTDIKKLLFQNEFRIRQINVDRIERKLIREIAWKPFDIRTALFKLIFSTKYFPAAVFATIYDSYL